MYISVFTLTYAMPTLKTKDQPNIQCSRTTVNKRRNNACKAAVNANYNNTVFTTNNKIQRYIMRVFFVAQQSNSFQTSRAVGLTGTVSGSDRRVGGRKRSRSQPNNSKMITGV